MSASNEPHSGHVFMTFHPSAILFAEPSLVDVWPSAFLTVFII
ncbi:hypothetical protein [Methanobrevibacter sp.]|nr:hypothetical protein [Methanobrevibacter sp.]MDO5859866.1 hypothetical protein [Methanobrevibacter sp.]